MKKNTGDTMKNLLILMITLSIFFVLISGWLFAYKQTFSTASEINSTRFYEYAQFVSAFVGITFAAFSAYLIYSAFNIQRLQLNNSNDQLNLAKKDSIVKMLEYRYEQILKDINEITYTRDTMNGFKTFTGIDAFYHWDEDTKKTNPNSVLNQLVFILASFMNYLELISKLVTDQSEQDVFLEKVYFLFHCKILWPFKEIMYKSPKVQQHTDAKLIFDNFDLLTVKSYKFLMEKSLLSNPSDPRIIELLKNIQ